MNELALRRDPELQRILRACLEYWQTEPLPPEKRGLCYKWVEGRYRALFGGTFHQSKLRELAKLGFLERRETSRGGNRRYYALMNPDRVAALVDQLVPA